MSVLYDEGQRAIESEARRILAARTDKARLLGLLEHTGGWDSQFWQTAVEQGWTAIAVPVEFGGLGLGLIELGIVAQASGLATAGAPFLAPGHGAVRALLAANDPGQAALWLPRISAGEVTAAIAFAEANSQLPASPALHFANGRLTGCKRGVCAGLFADIGVAWALHEGRPALVLVELAGVERRAIHSFDNSRGHADLVFEDAPATLLLEGEAAHAAAHEVVAHMAVVAAHEQLGGAEALLFIARDYALTRKAFGQPIGAFQSVKHRIAELYGLVEIARANCIHAAAREGQSDFLEAAAAARLSATEAYDTAARDCVQIHGGIGVTWETGLHLHTRRARSLAIECGNMFFWEDFLCERLTGVAA